MSHHHKLSLQAAVFININIMMGSGIFINSTLLAHKAGWLGSVCYVMVGLLMLPLILTTMRLLGLYPSGGFYAFASKEIHPYAGFVSSWSYATGKLASVVLMNQVAILLIQQIVPSLSFIDPLLCNGIIILLFLALNMLDIKTGSKIQTCFFVLKGIPILFAILAGLYLFSPGNIPLHDLPLSGIPSAIPFVLFALAGFEAACSLSSRIENAEKNAPKVVFFSYGFVVIVTTLFQFMISGGLGSLLAVLPDYRYLFPALFSAIFAQSFAMHAAKLMHLAIACSALGGSYGILFSNNWNFYTLAQHKHLTGWQRLIQLNRYAIPWLCVLIEGAICFIFLFTSRAQQVPLQQISAFGVVIAYTMSCVSLWFAIQRSVSNASPFLPLLGLGSCALLFCASMYSFITLGMSSLITFGVLFILGTLMFILSFKDHLTHLNGNQSEQT